jgi:DNA-binding CsgD family transcriptional regulator
VGHAAQLIITEGNFKRHLHSIYGKPDVTNRSQAQVRVRALELVE